MLQEKRQVTTKEQTASPLSHEKKNARGTNVERQPLQSLQNYSSKQAQSAYSSLEEMGRLLQQPGWIIEESYDALRERVVAAKDNILLLEEGLRKLKPSEITRKLHIENEAVLSHLEDCLQNTDEQIAVIQENRRRIGENLSIDSPPKAPPAPTGEFKETLSRWGKKDEVWKAEVAAEQEAKRKAKMTTGQRVWSWFRSKLPF